MKTCRDIIIHETRSSYVHPVWRHVCRVVKKLLAFWHN